MATDLPSLATRLAGSARLAPRRGRRLPRRPWSCYRVPKAILDKRASHANNRRQPFEDLAPGLSFIARAKELTASRAKIDSSRIERIHSHSIAQHGFVGLFLRQASR